MATIAVDFDGVLAKTDSSGNLVDIPQAAETLSRICSAGNEVVIYSARATPKDIMEISAWLNQHGLNGIKVYTKPEADFYIDDKALRFSGDWADISTQMQGIPLKAEKPFHSKILAGDCTLKEIGKYLNFNPDDFRRDLSLIFKPTANVAALDYSFKNKYGLSPKFATNLRLAEDQTEFVRLALSTAAKTFEEQTISPGNYICAKTLLHYGQLGEISAIVADGLAAEVEFLDGTKEIISRSHLIVAPNGFLLNAGAKFAIGPSELCISGLNHSSIASWYKKASEFIISAAAGEKVHRLHSLSHAMVPAKEEMPYTLSTDVLISPTLIGLKYAKSDNILGLHLCAALNHRAIAIDAIEYLTAQSAPKDVQVYYDGLDGIIFRARYEVQPHGFTLANISEAFPVISRLKPSILEEASVMGSINTDTGRVLLPINLSKFEAFDPLESNINEY